MLSILKLFWFTIDSSVPRNEWVQFFFHVFCLFFFMTSLIINVHLSMKTILVDPNLVCTLFGNIFFDLNYGAHP